MKIVYNIYKFINKPAGDSISQQYEVWCYCTPPRAPIKYAMMGPRCRW